MIQLTGIWLSIYKIIIFILELGFLIFVHEFGHFFSAKKLGIKVKEFGLGLPPRLFGIKRGETIYSINAVPFGGFVNIHGQDREVEEEKERSFLAKSGWVRFIVLVSGVVMNFIAGIFLFSLVYGKQGIPVQTDNVNIVGVTQDSPAKEAGIKSGDRILSISYNNTTEEIDNPDEFISLVDKNKGQEITVKLQRNEKTLEKQIRPRTDEEIPEQDGSLGVIISSVEEKHYVWWKMPFFAIKAGFEETVALTRLVFVGVVDAFRMLFVGQAPELAGPYQMYEITGQAAEQSIWTVFRLTGLISVNLAVLNLLPIPVLDGGRILFLVIEKIFGRKSIQKTEQVANLIGWAILLLIMILVTISDVVGG